jgi:hypothetical protein
MAEDFPSSTASPRNACLDGVASCDVYLVIVGTRGGWKTPSGKLAVEEEYDHARHLNKIICAYVQESERDADANMLTEKIGDYVAGQYRTSFSTPSNLEQLIIGGLSQVLELLKLPVMDVNEVGRRAEQCHKVQYETTCRLVLAPERAEEVIDRIEIGEKKFEEQVLAISHEGGFLSYRSAKEVAVRGDTLVIEQTVSRHDVDRRIEIEPSGTMTFDAVVSTRGEDPVGSAMGYMFVLVRDDVARPLTAAFRAVGRLYANIDSYLRHQRFYYAVAFCGVGHRDLADAIPQRSSFSMARDIQGPLLIEKSRLINRQVLDAPENEVLRIVKLLGRAIEAES